MKCPRCQHENEAGAKFCEECAAPLALACANCGRQASKTAKFCPECAHPTGLPVAGTTPRFTSPETYTPKHLAERILNSKSALEGERKQGLAQLQATEFLYETRLFPDLEYTFRHALTHEVTYSSLLADRRRALHARIMGAIESLYPERLAEHVERLAHHALRGEVWDKALAYQRQAGLRAVGRSAHREAAASFEQALVALQNLPQTRELLEQAVDRRGARSPPQSHSRLPGSRGRLSPQG